MPPPHLPHLCAQISRLFVPCRAEFQPSSGTVAVLPGDRVTVQDGQSSSLQTHSPVISPAMHNLHICIALHCLAHALTEPPSSPPPSCVSTPPSGSSKYFPSLLFEASMGHGTSCTNHAGLPWGGRSERTGVSQTRRNPICTVFLRGCFSCQGSHHRSAAGSKQRV